VKSQKRENRAPNVAETGNTLHASPGFASSTNQRVVFVLVPHFSMIAFSSAIEPLRIANRLSEMELYRWLVLSPEGETTLASNGVVLQVDGAIDKFARLEDSAPDRGDIVLVCGGVGSERYRNPALSAWLRRVKVRSNFFGALCTGTSVLAAAGVLHGYRCVIHWESLDGFTEAYPDIDVSADLYEIDRNLLTCAGGTAALDMMLHLIAEQHGSYLATQISEQCLADRVRDPYDHQRLSLCARLGVHNPKVLSAIEFMEAHVENPISVTELSNYVGLSSRQLERLFVNHLGVLPSQYYLEVRLRRARHLLRQSDMSIVEVAMACGFVSASHFSKCFRELYGRSPREERRSH